MNNMSNNVLSPCDVLTDSELDSVYALLEDNDISDVQFEQHDIDCHAHQFHALAVDRSAHSEEDACVVVTLCVSRAYSEYYVVARRYQCDSVLVDRVFWAA